MRKSNAREFFDVKINIRKFGIIARPAFRFGKNNGPQDLAALHRYGLLLLRCGFGMKRTCGGIGILPMIRRGLVAHATPCERSERAMIRDREPGTDRD